MNSADTGVEAQIGTSFLAENVAQRLRRCAAVEPIALLAALQVVVDHEGAPVTLDLGNGQLTVLPTFDVEALIERAAVHVFHEPVGARNPPIGVAVLDFQHPEQEPVRMWRVDVIDDTRHAIRELALEISKRAADQEIYDENDVELQLRFWVPLKPGDYGFGTEARLGRHFLREQPKLSCLAARP